MTSLHCDFLVIGAGMAGISAAAALASHGRVILLERESYPGYHATGRSAAIFADSYGNAIVRRLSAESRPVLEAWPAAGDSSLLRQRGLLYVTFDSSGAGSFDNLDHLPRLSAHETCEMVPILRQDAILDARWEGSAADIDVAMMQAGYLRLLAECGGILMREAAASRAQRRDGCWQIEAGHAVIQAPIVINAAGAWAGEVAAMLGAVDPGLVPMRRSAAIVDGPEGLPVERWPMVVDTDESVYFKPEGGKLMLSPADAEPSPPCDAYADDFAIAMAVDRLETITTQHVRRVRTPWAGLRTFVRDEAPLIGFDPRVEGLFWLAGQGGFGIQTAPAAAALTAALITGAAVDRDLVVGVSPARFS